MQCYPQSAYTGGKKSWFWIMGKKVGMLVEGGDILKISSVAVQEKQLWTDRLTKHITYGALNPNFILD